MAEKKQASENQQNKQVKQSFLGGAAILAGGAAIVKLIGAVYKIPLNNILGEVGKTYFNTAYEIYNVLLTISTAGLPLAISRLTSQARARGRENEKRKIFKTAIWLFFILGLTGAVFMFFGAENLAAFQNNSMAAQPIRALAPAVFWVCLLACMRGYTQGQGNMTPTAVSQILEALCKVCLGLPLAWYVLEILNMPLETGAAGAILGVTVGTVLSAFFMMFYLFRHRDTRIANDTPPGSGYLISRILAIGVPITLSNSAMSVITVMDTKIVMGRLQNGLGLTQLEAAALKGQYNYAMDMINMVVAFAYPVTISLLPAASAALARKEYQKTDDIISSAFRVIALLSFPAGVGLCVLSTPIMRLILPARPEAALAAGPHLKILAFSCILIFLMVLTNAILQTYGKEIIPIFTVIAGGLVKITMNYILVGNPMISIHGAPISTLCCYAAIVILNFIFVWKYSPRKPKYLSMFAKPVLASGIMGAAVWAAYGLTARIMGGNAATISFSKNALATLFSIIIGMMIYFVCVIALGILRADDVKSIPHGQTIIRVLRLK